MTPAPGGRRYDGQRQAVNGRVKDAASSAITATIVSYGLGTLALVVVAQVHHGTAPDLGTFPDELWLYGGGALGCLFIAGSAIVVRFTGVLVLGLSIVAGQLVCALMLDALAPSSGAGITPFTLAGTVLALAAVMVARVRGTARPGDMTKGP